MHSRFYIGLSMLGFVTLCPSVALAYCASLPNNLTNGSPADATQVMGNFACAALTSGSTIESLTSISGLYFTHGSDAFMNHDDVLGLYSNGYLYLQGNSSGGLALAGGSTRYDSIYISNATHEIDFYTGNNYSPPALAIDSSGNVNVGTVLNVSVNSTGYSLMHATNAGQGFALSEYSAGSSNMYVLQAANTVNWVGTGTGSGIVQTSGNLILAAPLNTPRLSILQASGNVGIGTTTPAQALEVNGQVRIDTLASASSTSLCITATTNGTVATCSSSIRYKENVKSADFGLKQVLAMRPVTFKWKGRNERDFGLIAEEVAKIDPLYVTYKDGRIEGVKYPQLTAVLVGAVKELKAENDKQIAEINQLRAQNAILSRQVKRQEKRFEVRSDSQAARLMQLETMVSALRRKIEIRTAMN